MLTCDDVRTLLSTVVTGEAEDPDVQRHIATCRACQEEQDRLEQDVERLRADLTLLAPSPFLEEAVLQAARGADVGRRRLRWPALALGAAAALLLVLLALPRDERGAQPDEHATGEEGRRATIVVRPSAATVHEARALNRHVTMNATLPPLGWNEGRSGLTLSRTVLPAGVVDSGVGGEAFLPAPADALHRYVYADPAARPADVGLRATIAPRAGVMLLGQGLLERIGGDVHAGPGVDIEKDGKRWRSTPGRPEGELWIVSPEAGGAEARIRVLVSTGYDGTLLLDEPLARALGLHLFEIPGRMRMEGAMTFTGQRARARVRVPELGFDQVLEVQVRPPDLARPRDLEEPYGLRIGAPGVRGLLPTEVLVGREIEWTASDRLDVKGDTNLQSNPDGVEWIRLNGEGAWQVLLRFASWSPEETLLVPGTLDVGSPTFLDEPAFSLGVLELSTSLAPGTPLTLARVWRGTTAIPSATAVVRTRVLEGGRVVAPILWGEQGATIRGLARDANGTMKFVDLVVNHADLAEPWLVFHVGPEGGVRLQSGDDPTVVGGALDAAVLADLRSDLGTLLDRPGWRDEDGTPRVTALLHVAEGAPWRVLQALMQVGASEGVRDYVFQRADPAWQSRSGPVEFQLPRDADLGAPPPPPSRTFEVVVTRRPERGVRVRLQIRKEDGTAHNPSGEGRTWTVEEATKVLQNGLVSADRAVIRTPPPLGDGVDAHSVIRLIDALKRAGFETIELEGAALPLPR